MVRRASGAVGPSGSTTPSPAELARRQWRRRYALPVVAIAGIAAFFVAFAVIDFESTRIEMRADCADRFAAGSPEFEQCIDAADAWP